MKKEFSKSFMQNHCGCYKEVQGKLDACSFMKGEDPITLKAIVESEIPLKDKYWFICRNAATWEENKKIALYAAEIVLPIYQKIYPDDNRVSNCIEVIKKYLAGNASLTQLKQARNAAAAAYAADAAAAYAADAAAAAYAADAAAAAAAAADAAYAAAAAAADAAIKTKLLSVLQSFY